MWNLKNKLAVRGNMENDFAFVLSPLPGVLKVASSQSISATTSHSDFRKEGISVISALDGIPCELISQS